MEKTKAAVDFYLESRKEFLLSKQPNANETEIFEMAYAEWQKLSEEEKKPFIEKEKEEKEKHKVKKPAGKKAPKKPLSAVFIYTNERTKELKKENPNMTKPEIMAQCSKEFQKLPPEQKKIYQDKAIEDKKRYEKEMEELNK